MHKIDIQRVDACILVNLNHCRVIFEFMTAFLKISQILPNKNILMNFSIFLLIFASKCAKSFVRP